MLNHLMFGDVKACVLRRKGKRDWEVGIGVSMNHKITFESIEFSFLTYIIPLYIYLE